MKNTNIVDIDDSAIQKPTSIIDYSHNMGGIDLNDQQINSIPILTLVSDPEQWM